MPLKFVFQIAVKEFEARYKRISNMKQFIGLRQIRLCQKG